MAGLRARAGMLVAASLNKTGGTGLSKWKKSES
jgi:hypothetical protein